jgi:PAS domain S-box-containing protein
MKAGPLAGPAWIDREMWEKVVLNLLSNAFKYTFEGGVTVSLAEGAGGFELTVSDTGTGIPPAELPRVFERFHRVPGARSRSHEGSGIGLALTQELVRLHGGDIRVSSTPGRGTTFTVVIPRGSAHLPAERLAGAAGDGPRPASALPFVEEALRWTADDVLPAGAAAEDGRILVADDNADMRAYLQRVLGTRWTVEAVADGAAALESARARRPDLVLSDVMMPGLDGFALLRELRADERTRGVPVVLLSARAGEESRAEGLERGADDYLVKPFSARELLARVASQVALARARDEADLQKRHLHDVFMQAPMPIVILRGRDHVIELVNAATCRVWGRQPSHVVGKPLLDALPELRSQPFKELLDGVLEGGTPYVGRETPAALDAHGNGRMETVYFDFVYAPLHAPQGGVEGVMVVAFDVTHEVRARRDLERLRGEAEAASRAKDDFLAMLSHELRNPLSPILTALQLMRLREGADVVERERSVIERQARNLTRLVDDLLDVSRITRGKISLTRRPAALSAVVARAVEIASPLLEERRHRLDVAVPHTLAVLADEHRLAQAVANLLTNAAKYTSPGGHVAVHAVREGGNVVLTVQDDGMGIAPELLPRVFDVFVQGTRTLDRSQGGLGLGLAIARSLVALHGGAMHAASAGLGQGSEFSIRLPLLETAVVEAEPLEAVVAAVGTADEGPRVLVVDDNQDAADVLAEALNAAGYHARAAYDGPAALEVARTFRPRVAMLDLGLPVMDGFELARHLRRLPETEGIRLVAVTGYGQAADREQSRDAGFEEHLVKPLDFTTVPGLLRAMVVPPDGKPPDGGLPEA